MEGKGEDEIRRGGEEIRGDKGARGRIEKFDEIRGNLKSSRVNRYSRCIYIYMIINNNLNRVKFLDYETQKL